MILIYSDYADLSMLVSVLFKLIMGMSSQSKQLLLYLMSFLLNPAAGFSLKNKFIV